MRALRANGKKYSGASENELNGFVGIADGGDSRYHHKSENDHAQPSVDIGTGCRDPTKNIQPTRRLHGAGWLVNVEGILYVCKCLVLADFPLQRFLESCISKDRKHLRRRDWPPQELYRT